METGARPKRRYRHRDRSLDAHDTGIPCSFADLTPRDGPDDSDGGSSAAARLERDIAKLQDEIKILSAHKAADRRKSIRQALESNNNSEIEFLPNSRTSTDRTAVHNPPTKTSDSLFGEGDESPVLATGHRRKTCLLYTSDAADE